MKFLFGMWITSVVLAMNMVAVIVVVGLGVFHVFSPVETILLGLATLILGSLEYLVLRNKLRALALAILEALQDFDRVLRVNAPKDREHATRRLNNIFDLIDFMTEWVKKVD